MGEVDGIKPKKGIGIKESKVFDILNNGIYFLSIRTSKGMITKKIMKF